MLDVAHLDGDTAHNDPENRATLCRTCHRALDYPSWAEKRRQWAIAERERRLNEKDAARPILAYLQEAS